MTSRPYLPLATEYREPFALQDVRDTDLVKMQEDCDSWMVEMALFRQSLLTPASLVLWNALIEADREMVADAVNLVSQEIDHRKSNAATDAVPAPGEEFDALGRDRIPSSDDDHASSD